MLRSAISLGAAAVSNALCGLLFKYSLTGRRETAAAALAGAPIFLGLNALCYRRSLAAIPLSVAYPLFSATSMLLMCCGAAFVFGETLSARQMAGMAIIIFGSILVCAK